MKKQILGVKIDDVSKEEGLKIVEGWLVSSRRRAGSPSLSRLSGIPLRGDLGKYSHSREMLKQVQHDTRPKLVFTPGPEFLVTAQNDPEFKKILNAGDLNLPDGYGLKIFAGITHVVPGVEFMLALCQLAAEKGWTVGLVGRRFVTETASELIKRYPKIKIKVIEIPGQARNDTDLLFVGLGHPEQEKFLYRLKKDDPLAKGSSFLFFKVGMGVGGSFNFISGQMWEPGTIYKRLGLKWLGRFLSEPVYMLPKIFKAVVLFPFLVLKEKFS